MDSNRIASLLTYKILKIRIRTGILKICEEKLDIDKRYFRVIFKLKHKLNELLHMNDLMINLINIYHFH